MKLKLPNNDAITTFFIIACSLLMFSLGYKLGSSDVKKSAIRAGVAHMVTDKIKGSSYFSWITKDNAISSFK